MYPFIKKPNVLMKVYYFVLHRVTDGRNQCCTFFTTGRCASTSVGAYVRDDGDRRQTTKTKDTHAKTKYWINGVWCISVQVRGKCVSTSSTSTVVVHYQQWYPKTRLEWSTSLCPGKKNLFWFRQLHRYHSTGRPINGCTYYLLLLPCNECLTVNSQESSFFLLDDRILEYSTYWLFPNYWMTVI